MLGAAAVWVAAVSSIELRGRVNVRAAHNVVILRSAIVANTEAEAVLRELFSTTCWRACPEVRCMAD